jgi:hypothetical protein
MSIQSAQENVNTSSLVLVRWLRDYVAMLKQARKIRYGEFVDLDSKIDERIAEVESFLTKLTTAQVIN